MLKIKRVTCSVLIAGLLAAFACSQEESTEQVCAEYDRAELTELMESARAAIEKKDEMAFQALFRKGGASRARSVWQKINREMGVRGFSRIVELTGALELERAVPGIHVSSLSVTAWFHFFVNDKRGGKISSTTWQFKRSGDGSVWALENLTFNHGFSSYGDIMVDLHQMSRLSFLAMAMDWEESIDPTPLLEKTFRALTLKDLEILNGCTLDGTLFLRAESAC